MPIQEVLAVLFSLLSLFFKNNPTVEEIEALLPQVMAALASAKAGQAFSVTFPLTVDGVAGTSVLSWTPGGKS